MKALSIYRKVEFLEGVEQWNWKCSVIMSRQLAMARISPIKAGLIQLHKDYVNYNW